MPIISSTIFPSVVSQFPLPRAAVARMEDALKKGAEARKQAIALSSLEYSGDLSQRLLAFSNKMESTFKYIQDLRSKKVDDPKKYDKYFAIVEDQLAWFTKAEARPNLSSCFVLSKS